MTQDDLEIGQRDGTDHLYAMSERPRTSARRRWQVFVVRKSEVNSLRFGDTGGRMKALGTSSCRNRLHLELLMAAMGSKKERNTQRTSGNKRSADAAVHKASNKRPCDE